MAVIDIFKMLICFGFGFIIGFLIASLYVGIIQIKRNKENTDGSNNN